MAHLSSHGSLIYIWKDLSVLRDSESQCLSCTICLNCNSCTLKFVGPVGTSPIFGMSKTSWIELIEGGRKGCLVIGDRNRVGVNRSCSRNIVSRYGIESFTNNLGKKILFF